MLRGRCLVILAARSKTPTKDTLRLVDHLDGAGARIERWDEAALGPRPLPAELAAVSDSAALSAQADEVNADRGKSSVSIERVIREAFYFVNGRYPNTGESAAALARIAKDQRDTGKT